MSLKVPLPDRVDAPVAVCQTQERARAWAAFTGRRGDVLALGTLCVVVGLIVWNRLAFDSWLARFDIYTQYLPWFAYLGRRLRAGEIPAWNPHQFAGTPFAGDPQSDWMYFPAMLAFALLSVLTAFKAMVAAQLIVAAAGVYGLARALGLRPAAALVAAAAYVGGPVLQWNSYCCLIMGQFATWVPAALLGVEIALRPGGWRRRVVGWCLAGLALSQIFAGWVGEGWLDGVLLVGCFAAYRGLAMALERDRRRAYIGAASAALTAAMAVVLGAGLGAAGILPRLAFNRESNLAGGDYASLGQPDTNNPAWSTGTLFAHLLGSGYAHRLLAPGGAVIVLVLLAPLIARGHGAVPFFAVLTAVSLILTLHRTPVHAVFYAIPRFRVLHEHDPWRSSALGVIGPPMLAGAAVDALLTGRATHRLPVLLIPPAILAAGAVALDATTGSVGWDVLAAGGIAATASIVLARFGPLHTGAAWVGRVGAVVLVGSVVAQPAGLELTGSWLGHPLDRTWTSRWNPPASVRRMLASEIASADPNGAGAFLQERLAEEGPFRYFGYGGSGYPGSPRGDGGSYMDRRLDPAVHALLVNGRSVFLGLFDIQGYNPVELARYAAFIRAVNGTPQNYHLADVLPSGTGSTLLDLLDVRYVVVDASLPTSRRDVAALVAGRTAVYWNRFVVVYQTQPAPRHAWIAHDVRVVARSDLLALLAGGDVDPHVTALLDQPTPAVATAAATAPESAEVIENAPELMRIAAHASAPGLLVVSEVAASGWRATVDGRPAPILVTDGVLRGIPIPAGDHVVTLRYRPTNLVVGTMVSVLVGIGMSAALVVVIVSRWPGVRPGSRPRRVRRTIRLVTGRHAPAAAP